MNYKKPLSLVMLPLYFIVIFGLVENYIYCSQGIIKKKNMEQIMNKFIKSTADRLIKINENTSAIKKLTPKQLEKRKVIWCSMYQKAIAMLNKDEFSYKFVNKLKSDTEKMMISSFKYLELEDKEIEMRKTRLLKKVSKMINDESIDTFTKDRLRKKYINTISKIKIILYGCMVKNYEIASPKGGIKYVNIQKLITGSISGLSGKKRELKRKELNREYFLKLLKNRLDVKEILELERAYFLLNNIYYGSFPFHQLLAAKPKELTEVRKFIWHTVSKNAIDYDMLNIHIDMYFSAAIQFFYAS